MAKWIDECVCEKYAEQRRLYPTCMAFWCPVHDDIEGSFKALELFVTNSATKPEREPDGRKT